MEHGGSVPRQGETSFFLMAARKDGKPGRGRCSGRTNAGRTYHAEALRQISKVKRFGRTYAAGFVICRGAVAIFGALDADTTLRYGGPIRLPAQEVFCRFRNGLHGVGKTGSGGALRESGRRQIIV